MRLHAELGAGFTAGCASPVVLEACHISVLEFVDLESLKAHAVKD